MAHSPKLAVRFYRTSAGNEPVRDWLKNELTKSQRQAVGEDILTVQYRWPLGMPLVRKIDAGLWEVRTMFKEGIARVFFTVHDAERAMVLLHGFIKKSQKTPPEELMTAYRRRNNLA